MKRLLFSLSCLLATLTACVGSDDYTTSNRDSFEALWKAIDEHYCFFDYKQQQYGLDWNEVYRRYSPQVSDSMSRRALFQVLSNMTYELRDGHVNLWTAYDIASYADWYEAYPANFSDSLERKYIGRHADAQISGGLRYRVLPSNIGYLRCASFNIGIGEGNLEEVMEYLALCDGLIIDVRSNTGGLLTSAVALASAFCNDKTTVGYIAHKTGRAHQSFSTPQPITITPASGLRWQKPIVILTNRRTFSAGNAFVMFMRCFPNVTTMGDRTGGGSGMPFSSELPNGWGIRFSASPIYNINMEHTEFGIDPDVRVDISPDDYRRDVDTILERAIAFLLSKR